MPSHPIQRLLVALDGSPCSHAVLRTAARLAQGLHVELLGIFVEDQHLFQAAALPIAQEVGARSCLVRTLGQDDIARDYRALTHQTAHTATQVVRQFDIEWHFEIRRGQVTEELIALAGPHDLLCLGRYGWPLFPHRRLGSVARTVLTHRPAPLLLLSSEILPQHPIFVTFEGTPAAQQRLQMAARLARLYQSTLTVLLQGNESKSLYKMANTALAGYEQTIEYRQVDLQFWGWDVGRKANRTNATMLTSYQPALMDANPNLALLFI